MTMVMPGTDTSAGQAASRRRWPGRRGQAATAYAMIVPAGLFYAAFQLLPIIFAFTLSFFNWDGVNLGQARFAGLANYRQLLHDPLLWHSVWHNVLIAAAVLIVQCGGSFLIAAVIQAGIKGGRFFRLVFFAPMVISSVATGMLAIFIYSPSQGLLNSLLGAVHLSSWEQPWLGSGTWALPTVTVTYILQSFGLSVLLFISALSQVNNDLLEAAEIDGAGQGTILWKVVFPVIRPVASVVFLLGVVQAFRLFDQVYVMTAGGPYHASDTIVTYLYSVAFGGNEVGYGNAIGVLLFVILLVIALIQLRVTRAGEGAGEVAR
jgi:raffinose/stachyose/melibiose transport system permease protein